jgi:hypothetical protein
VCPLKATEKLIY